MCRVLKLLSRHTETLKHLCAGKGYPQFDSLKEFCRKIFQVSFYMTDLAVPHVVWDAARKQKVKQSVCGGEHLPQRLSSGLCRTRAFLWSVQLQSHFSLTPTQKQLLWEMDLHMTAKGLTGSAPIRTHIQH